MADPSEVLGRSMLGSYRLLSEVGRDPLGVLFLACPAGARSFPKWAILRRMHPGLARDPVMVHAFLAATQAASRMVHRNIASTFDSGGRTAVPWAAREHLFGASVLDVIASLTAGQGRARMPWALAGYIVSEAAEGVAALRARLPDYGPPMGFLAGAVAPSVFLTRGGEVKIVDGCLALIDGQPLIDSEALAYRPAQAASDPAAAGRSDAFGLGVILWELIAGRRLFAGKDDAETARLVRARLTLPLRTLSSAPPAIDAIVLRALGAGPSPFTSAAALATELRAALASERGARGLAAGDDVAQALSGMFADVFAEQEAAVMEAWERERSLQAMGDVPVESASEGDLTIPLGQTVPDSTSEAPTIALPGRFRVGDGFDEIPTVPRGGASMVAGPPSWRERARPSLPSSPPERVASPRIAFVVEPPPSRIPPSPRPVPAPPPPPPPPPTPPPPPPTPPPPPPTPLPPLTPRPFFPADPPRDAGPLPGLFDVDADLEPEREGRTTTFEKAPSSLVLPPVERLGIAPLSERRPLRRDPPPRAGARVEQPTGPTARVLRQRALLVAGAIGFGFSTIVIVLVVVFVRVTASPDPVAPVVAMGPVPSASGPVARGSAADASVSARRAVDAWTPIVTAVTPEPAAVRADDLPLAPPASRGTVRPRPPRSASPEPEAKDPPPAHGPGGLLTVFCTPACDEVYDGRKPLGPSPVFKVPTTAGVHRLRLRVDSREKTVTVTVPENDTAVVRETVGE